MTTTTDSAASNTTAPAQPSPAVAASFADLQLHERLLKATGALAFSQPTAVQSAAIPAALAGRDLFAIAKTGSGKTAAFVLPMLQTLLEDDSRPTAPRGLILSPTRELARQILGDVEKLASFTFLKAELVTGGEDFKVQAARLRRNPDLVIATPGRALEQLAAKNLDFSAIKVLVLDEGDRMLDMGFSDDVITLADACSGPHQTLLFSATPGDARLQHMLGSVLTDPLQLLIDDHRVDGSSITQQVIPADDNPHKEAQLKWLLSQQDNAKVMVFTNTRDMADRLQGVLITAGQRAFVLHGDKDQKVRKQAIERFKQSRSAVLVATDVAARGLDIEALDMVINFDMPRTGDDYLHRVGRTGRAGASGVAICLVAAHEWNLMVSIERYLRRQFERRILKAVPGNFKGPKNLKASGKPVGRKKDPSKRKGTKRPTSRTKKSPPRVSSDGMAPLKRPPRKP